nr:hypothetical protein [Tanacetum cinerariifolium]
MFRINPDKTSREAKKGPYTVSASARTKPITVSQPPVITKKDVNSDLNGLSSTGVDNTKTRRPRPRSNIKNDRVPSTSKSSRSKNKGYKVEEHHRNLLLSKNNKHISSACNNIKIDSQDSSRSKNKEVEVAEHHRKLLLSRNKKHMSSECINVKLATQNVKSKVACAICKQCLISVNHDVCLLNYVNGMTSRDLA